MNFHDLMTRIFDRVSPVYEAVSTIPDVQQRIINWFGTEENMVVSTWSSEPWYKFWMMNDGTVIPVTHAHESPGEWFNTESVIQSGAIRGHIDENARFMSLQVKVDPTIDQIEKLKKLFLKYEVEDVRFEYRGKNGRDFDTYVDSADKLAYMIEYGPIEEKKLKEDGAGPAPAAPAGPVTGPNVGGSTTEDDIKALPTHLGASSARKRKKKKVTMIKGLVKEAVGHKEMSAILRVELKDSIMEAIDKDLDRLRKELKLEFVKMLNHDEFTDTTQVWNNFRSVFGIGQSRTQGVAITCERQQKDAQKLYGNLLREHGEDKGSLEMIISAVREKRPLGQFPVMKKYDNLFGTRTEVVFQGVKLVLEATVDFIYDPTQTMYIDDPELLDKIEENFGSIIKRSKNVIYPVGGKFRHDFFNQLKSMMSDSVEEPEHEE